MVYRSVSHPRKSHYIEISEAGSGKGQEVMRALGESHSVGLPQILAFCISALEQGQETGRDGTFRERWGESTAQFISADPHHLRLSSGGWHSLIFDRRMFDV